jgi:type I restriction enzyme S subunit
MIPFDLPNNWDWIPLGDICSYVHRGKSPKYSNIKKYPVISQKCNQWIGVDMTKCLFIDPDTMKKYDRLCYVITNDILINSTGFGTLGRIGIYNESLNSYELAVADSHVTVVRCSFIESKYLYYYLAGPWIQSIIEDLSSGSTKQKELSTGTIVGIPVPVPPINEQKRIISKIEELLPLTRKIDGADNKLNMLYVELPGKLGLSITQYAIQGKLVPNNPNDEPLKMDCKNPIIRRDNSYYEVINGRENCIDNEIPFIIPKNWIWIRLKDLGLMKRGNGIKRSEITATGMPCIRYGELYTKYIVKTINIYSHVNKQLFDRCTHIKKNDLLITLTGETKEDIGKTIAYLGDCNIAYGGDLVCLSNHNQDPLYLSYFFNSPYCIEEKNRMSNGDQIIHLGVNKLEKLLIPVPPKDEQIRISSTIEHLSIITNQLSD